MKLPNIHLAVIAPEKLRDYLLNEAHPDNNGKARLFRGLGYTREDWPRLESDLRGQHLPQDAIEQIRRGDRRWRIDATLSGPRGNTTIASIWEISDEGVPRFLTAYRGRT